MKKLNENKIFIILFGGVTNEGLSNETWIRYLLRY